MRKLILIVLMSLLSGIAYAEPDYEKLCSAIRIAEGNENYGILAHYKHTTYKQACINTCRHKWQDWARNGKKGAYLEYLASKYAPIGASNDPTGLNKNWLKNVSYYYKEDV